MKQKLISWSILVALALSGIVLVLFLRQHTENITDENRTYNRFIACGLSVPAEERTRDKIDLCWDMAQEDTGYNVKRYDFD